MLTTILWTCDHNELILSCAIAIRNVVTSAGRFSGFEKTQPTDYLPVNFHFLFPKCCDAAAGANYFIARPAAAYRLCFINCGGWLLVISLHTLIQTAAGWKAECYGNPMDCDEKVAASSSGTRLGTK